MSNEIAVIDQSAIVAAFQQTGGIDTLIDRIRKEAQSEVPDLSTAKGRARIASLAHKVSKTKVVVDDYGKELVVEEKKRLALIDADRKKWRDTCDAIRDEIRKPLTDWEAAETARVQAHKDAIEEMRELPRLAMGASSDFIRGLLEKAESVPLGDHWQEFAADAGKVKDETIAILRTDLDRRLKTESEQAELSRLREEAARREQEDRERRIAEEAAERARIEAEAKAKAEREAAEREARRAQEEAERARIAAEQAEARAKAEAEAAKLREQEAERRRVESEERAAREAKEAAERAERDRIAAIEAERQRAERQRIAEKEAADKAQSEREASKEHVRKINRAALDGIVGLGISEDHAKVLIVAIAAGKIANVSIRY